MSTPGVQAARLTDADAQIYEQARALTDQVQDDTERQFYDFDLDEGLGDDDATDSSILENTAITIQGLVRQAETPAQKAALVVAGIETLNGLGEQAELDTTADSAALLAAFDELVDSSMKSSLAQSPVLAQRPLVAQSPGFRAVRQNLAETVEAAGQERQVPARSESAEEARKDLRATVGPSFSAPAVSESSLADARQQQAASARSASAATELEVAQQQRSLALETSRRETQAPSSREAEPPPSQGLSQREPSGRSFPLPESRAGELFASYAVVQEADDTAEAMLDDVAGAAPEDPFGFLTDVNAQESYSQQARSELRGFRMGTRQQEMDRDRAREVAHREALFAQLTDRGISVDGLTFRAYHRLDEEAATARASNDVELHRLRQERHTESLQAQVEEELQKHAWGPLLQPQAEPEPEPAAAPRSDPLEEIAALAAPAAAAVNIVAQVPIASVSRQLDRLPRGRPYDSWRRRITASDTLRDLIGAGLLTMEDLAGHEHAPGFGGALPDGTAIIGSGGPGGGLKYLDEMENHARGMPEPEVGERQYNTRRFRAVDVQDLFEDARR